MAETKKCKICGAETREEHSFVFNTDFYFCPNKCGQVKTESFGDGMCFVCGKTLNNKNSCPDKNCSSHEGGN